VLFLSLFSFSAAIGRVANRTNERMRSWLGGVGGDGSLSFFFSFFFFFFFLFLVVVAALGFGFCCTRAYM